MAELSEVKRFKQYLVDTKVFQTLSEAISSLHRAEPKPENPLQFICEHLFGPFVDLKEVLRMKENLERLNVDVTQLKTNMDKVMQLLPKESPSEENVAEMMPDIPIESTSHNANGKMNGSSTAISVQTGNTVANASFDSMENNVGSVSHISLKDDSSMIFDQSADQTMTLSSNDLHGTTDQSGNIDVGDISQSAEKSDAPFKGFTMEFVEVDVIHQSHGSSSHISSSSRTAEKMQVDDAIVESMTGDLPDKLLATSTPDHTLSDEDTVANESQIDTNIEDIEDMPIVMKFDSKDETELFGFDASDVRKSEKALAILTLDKSDSQVLQNTNNNDNDDDDASKIDDPNPSELMNTRSTQVNNVIASKDLSTEIVANLEDAKVKFVENLLDEGFDTTSKDNVDSAHTDDINAEQTTSDENHSQISMLKDDAETQLFLSYS